MRYLAAAVVLVGLLCSIDLILTLGVIKRLREHGEVLSRRGPWMSAILPAGSMVSLLSQAAHVVVEAPFGPVAAAFQVATFPAFCLLDEHHAVVASGADLEAIPAAPPA